MIIDVKMKPGIAAVPPTELKLGHLPFVRVRFKRGRQKIEWWHVRSNGNEYDDGVVGAAYAVEALQFLMTPGQENSPLLYHVFAAMGKKKHADIERGFINTLMSFARRGIEKSLLEIEEVGA